MFRFLKDENFIGLIIISISIPFLSFLNANFEGYKANYICMLKRVYEFVNFINKEELDTNSDYFDFFK